MENVEILNEQYVLRDVKNQSNGNCVMYLNLRLCDAHCDSVTKSVNDHFLISTFQP
jgi:hypothetical protein